MKIKKGTELAPEFDEGDIDELNFEENIDLIYIKSEINSIRVGSVCRVNILAVNQ